ncbi:16S rRNA (cytosine(967)-C(5))-methyltransferase RsmB [Piscinibacter sp.]|uniref:16S rRNA (cytosine(967)-C(5))-methyltransferase RsmB n=1 Tax=Piscinibacter sp. TaxID=1903157 RepID=UPI002C492332|nr:16S rRNA (cytosine(967)-C(5))-methyltransferase RsmB [Albitalea sp.]HUG24893.1 16S rRNA (cytosine(967)-C(5))-methyltransferase RsmB [Albitalea sp.]
MKSSSNPSLPLARLLAHTADAVQAVRAGQSLNDALARCPSEARPGTQALSFHALRWLGSAHAARERLAPKAPPPPVDALLLTAISLLWPGAEAPYPAHTLVDQAVTAARQRHKAGASFVNAVLRRFLRERDAIVAAVQHDPVAAHNHPAWWSERLRADWPDDWQALLAADNLRPPMTLRVNARRSTAAAYVQRLAGHGIAAQAFGAQTVVLAVPCPVTRLPGFTEGDVSVQDAAAQLAAPLLIGEASPAGAQADWRLPPGAHVLDACAAPGGKTAHLLELAELDVLALDSDPERLKRVGETLQRLSLHARTVAADAARPDTWWDGRPFDAILLDAPCSASGIVRRHPDVRWLRRSTDIAALAKTQARLLDALWPTLKPGGRLLYCTCSVFKAEGQAQIDAFLQRQAQAGLVRHPPAPGHLLPLPDNGTMAGAPPFGASPDGFFLCLLQKT